MFDAKELMHTVNIKHVWIFLTDRCNLNCDYCFFKYRTNSKTLPYVYIKNLFDLMLRGKKYDFVLSGGEPLLEWKLTKKMIHFI